MASSLGDAITRALEKRKEDISKQNVGKTPEQLEQDRIDVAKKAKNILGYGDKPAEG